MPTAEDPSADENLPSEAEAVSMGLLVVDVNDPASATAVGREILRQILEKHGASPVDDPGSDFDGR